MENNALKNLVGTTNYNGKKYTIGHHVSLTLPPSEVDIYLFDYVKDVFRALGVVNQRVPVLCGVSMLGRIRTVFKDYLEAYYGKEIVLDTGPGTDRLMKNGILFLFTPTYDIGDNDIIFITGHPY